MQFAQFLHLAVSSSTVLEYRATIKVLSHASHRGTYYHYSSSTRFCFHS